MESSLKRPPPTQPGGVFLSVVIMCIQRNFAQGQSEKLIFGAPFVSRLLKISRARVCILPAPQSPSPKLETTRSLNLTDGVSYLSCKA